MTTANTNIIEQATEAGAGEGAGTSASAARPARTKKGAAPATLAPASRKETKADAILKRLRSAKGATLVQLIEATGWQAHSVRGYLSGTIKKKLGLELTSEPGKDGVRRYRVTETVEGNAAAPEAESATTSATTAATA